MSASFKLGSLEVILEEKPQRIVARWIGRSEARDPSKELDPFLVQLLDRSAKENRTLELRFEKLEHFNSATVGALLRMINSARDRQLHLELWYDQGLRWQSVSFEALTSAVRSPGQVAPPTIRIRPVERTV